MNGLLIFKYRLSVVPNLQLIMKMAYQLTRSVVRGHLVLMTDSRNRMLVVLSMALELVIPVRLQELLQDPALIDPVLFAVLVQILIFRHDLAIWIWVTQHPMEVMVYL